MATQAMTIIKPINAKAMPIILPSVLLKGMKVYITKMDEI